MFVGCILPVPRVRSDPSDRIIGMDFDLRLLPRLINFFGLGGKELGEASRSKEPSDKEVRIGLLGASQVPIR